MLEGGNYFDWNVQFEYINKKVEVQFVVCNFVIFVDMKKKELIGDFKNIGKELCLKGLFEFV